MGRSIHDTVADLRCEKNVQGLISILNSKNPSQARAQAAHALGRIGDPRAVPTLARFISQKTEYPDEVLSRYCTGALILIGKSAVPSLCDEITGYTHTVIRSEKALMFWNEDKRIQKIIKIIGIIGDNQAVEPLCDLINQWTDRCIRSAISPGYSVYSALEALGEIGDPSAASVVVSALAGVRTGPMNMRKICQTLSGIGDESILVPLREYYIPVRKTSPKRARSEDRTDQEWIQIAISDIETGRGRITTERRIAFREFTHSIEGEKNPDLCDIEKIITAIYNKDTYISETAVWSLGRMGTPVLPILEANIPELLQKISQFPSNSEVFFYIHLRNILSCIGPDGIPWVLSRILDPNPDTFRFLLSWLHDMTIDERHIPELINLYSRIKDPMMQYRLLHFMGELSDAGSKKYLKNKMHSIDGNEKIIASIGLLPRRAKELMISQLFGRKESSEMVIEVFASEKETLSYFLKAFYTYDESFRMHVRYYVRDTRDPESIEILVSLLDHQDNQLRLFASQAIIHSPSLKKIELLQVALKGSYSRNVKKEIQNIINRIS